MSQFFRRRDRDQQIPLDPERHAAIRRSLRWVPISYLPLFGGIAWWLFATDHWAGMRGLFLASSGLMICLAASSALFFPTLDVLSPNRRLLGMSLSRYTLVSCLLAIAIAIALSIAAIATPES
jgi:hypothetical protein